jgi:hypothetical protein
VSSPFIKVWRMSAGTQLTRCSNSSTAAAAMTGRGALLPSSCSRPHAQFRVMHCCTWLSNCHTSHDATALCVLRMWSAAATGTHITWAVSTPVKTVLHSFSTRGLRHVLSLSVFYQLFACSMSVYKSVENVHITYSPISPPSPTHTG